MRHYSVSGGDLFILQMQPYLLRCLVKHFTLCRQSGGAIYKIVELLAALQNRLDRLVLCVAKRSQLRPWPADDDNPYQYNLSLV